MNARSVLAILAGAVFIAGATWWVDRQMYEAGVFPGTTERLDDRLAAIATSYRFVIGVLGAWLTARLAPRERMKHALILGAVGVVVGLLGVAVTWNLDLGPRWYPIALVLLAMPQSWVGGMIAARGNRPPDS